MKSHEKRLYMENSLSQQLMMYYILGNTAFIIFYVVNMAVDAQLGVFVMLNIFLTLLGFLTAVRQKLYDIRWGYVGLGLAAYQLVRLLWLPQELTGSLRIMLVLLAVVTSILAFTGSILCIRRAHERQNFISEHNVDLSTLQK